MNMNDNPNGYHPQDGNIDSNTFANIHHKQKIQAALYLENTLCCILTRFFIESWDDLKRNYYENNRFLVKESIKYRQDHGVTLENVEKTNTRRQHHSYRSRVVRQHIPSLDSKHQLSRSLAKNRSVRFVDTQTEYSRANILKQIVQKLRAHKLSIEDEDDDETNVQVYRKLSRLEALIKDMKTEKISHESDNIVLEEMNEPEPNNQNQTFIHQFMDQIQEIRKEISQIKANNQQIQRNQLERSRAESQEHRRQAHHTFQRQVLQYDQQIQLQIKVVEKKVDLVLEQLKADKIKSSQIDYIKKQELYNPNAQQANSNYNQRNYEQIRAVTRDQRRDYIREDKKQYQRDYERDHKRDNKRDDIRHDQRDYKRDSRRDDIRQYQRDDKRQYTKDYTKDYIKDNKRDYTRDYKRDYLKQNQSIKPITQIKNYNQKQHSDLKNLEKRMGQLFTKIQSNRARIEQQQARYQNIGNQKTIHNKFTHDHNFNHRYNNFNNESNPKIPTTPIQYGNGISTNISNPNSIHHPTNPSYNQTIPNYNQTNPNSVLIKNESFSSFNTINKGSGQQHSNYYNQHPQSPPISYSFQKQPGQFNPNFNGNRTFSKFQTSQIHNVNINGNSNPRLIRQQSLYNKYGTNFCGNCGRACVCQPVPGFIRKF